MKKAFVLLLALAACQNSKSTEGVPFPTQQQQSINATWPKDLTAEEYEDKLLGLLVGSAIGDAMGAPTEMWHHSYIKQQVGFVDSLDVHIRTASAEGPWGDYLPGGGTTDDTRWKYLTAQYLLKEPSRPDSLSDKRFGQHIVDQYQTWLAELKATEGFSPEPYEQKMMQVNWVQEWAKVAKPYVANDLNGYATALNKFYGGEMVCGGMLYAPMLGGMFPANPQKAYNESFRLGYFDLGYARDITGLTAAMVAKAMQKNVKPHEIMQVCRDVDPQGYFKSRLTGRIANRHYVDAVAMVYEARKNPSVGAKPPKNFKRGEAEWAVMDACFKLLEAKNQDMPFHAGEIHLINLTALEYAQGDFQKAMEFVVNFGRDNDTVGAVTGGILGAYLGLKQLPAEQVKKVLAVNKNIAGMDLVTIGKTLAKRQFLNEK
jgi:hypothetical protein